MLELQQENIVMEIKRGEEDMKKTETEIQDELEERIWDSIQAFLYKNPRIRNTEELEELLSGVEKEVALELMKKSEKQQVQDEILARLNDSIDEEIGAMSGHYTIAEIAQEVLKEILLHEKR